MNVLPEDMENEIKKLAEQYPITYDKARYYYLMGGYEHAKKLLDLELIGASDTAIEFLNQEVYNKRKDILIRSLSELSK